MVEARTILMSSYEIKSSTSWKCADRLNNITNICFGSLDIKVYLNTLIISKQMEGTEKAGWLAR